MATPSPHSASVALPIALPASQSTSSAGQQIDWASKIAEVMRDQFGLKPKQQNLMYRTPYPTDQLPLPHKANKIFDLLLLEGQIKLKPYHKIPTDQELKNIKYCKWHNATSHDTNECKVFRQCWHSLEPQFTYRKRTDRGSFSLRVSLKVYQSLDRKRTD